MSNSRKTVKEILMKRDNMSESDANDLINSFKDELETAMSYGEGLCEYENLIEEYFGLEPDYLDEFMDW